MQGLKELVLSVGPRDRFRKSHGPPSITCIYTLYHAPRVRFRCMRRRLLFVYKVPHPAHFPPRPHVIFLYRTARNRDNRARWNKRYLDREKRQGRDTLSFRAGRGLQRTVGTMSGGSSTYERVVSKADDIADRFLRYSKHYLPHLARLCLISTFLEDGMRMWFQWSDQKDYINITWRCGEFIGHIFVLVNMVFQLAGCGMILIRKYVYVAVGMLFGIIILQTLTYTVLWDFRFFLRNIALAGGLVLLLAEASAEAKTMFAGVPSMGGNQKKSYLQLAGRVLTIFMFLTLFSPELSAFRLVELLIGSVLVVCVGIGYKTKLSALILVAWLTITNFILNAFWVMPYNRIMRDFMKYDFFQTFSVIGGLLFVVALGPGGVSIDEHKKEW